MWFEHNDELFNMDHISSVCCVGTHDIALYESIVDGENSEYFLLTFDSVRERNECFDFIKKSLNPVRYGQADKKDRKTREESL